MRKTNTMVVLVGGVHAGTIAGVEFAKSLNPDHLLAVHITTSDEDGKLFAKKWAVFEPDVDLEVVVDPTATCAARSCATWRTSSNGGTTTASRS